jgi:hypothetical protein
VIGDQQPSLAGGAGEGSKLHMGVQGGAADSMATSAS